MQKCCRGAKARLGSARLKVQEASWVKDQALQELERDRAAAAAGGQGSTEGGGGGVGVNPGEGENAMGGGLAAGGGVDFERTVAELAKLKIVAQAAQDRLSRDEAAEQAAAQKATEVSQRPLAGAREWNVTRDCSEGKCPICKKASVRAGGGGRCTHDASNICFSHMRHTRDAIT